MFSINMTLFKSTLVLLLAFLSSNQVGCLPLEESPTSASSALSSTVQNTDHFDQRQNGSENYHIHIDGFVVVVAPVEALLLAGDAVSGANLSDTSILGSTAKPEEEKPSLENHQKPISSPKSAHRSSLRFMNLLAPLIRRFQHKE